MKKGEGGAQPPRRLSGAEHELWRATTRSIKPLRVRKPAGAPSPEPSPADENPPRKRAAVQPAPVKPANIPPPLVPLDRRLRQRLARGVASIDRRLDLHGMTQSEAHHALLRVLRAVQAQGGKTVLVVTGKGAPAAGGDPFAERGVLRRSVPMWLAQPEFRNLVVGFETAHLAHGGSGALYVRVRKKS
jgi:DNA-nicking Smr family endonuclease